MAIDTTSAYFWVGLVIVAMFGGAFNSKALAATVAFVVGLSMVYPDTSKGLFLAIFYIPAVIVSQFRD